MTRAVAHLMLLRQTLSQRRLPLLKVALRRGQVVLQLRLTRCFPHTCILRGRVVQLQSHFLNDWKLRFFLHFLKHALDHLWLALIALVVGDGRAGSRRFQRAHRLELHKLTASPIWLLEGFLTGRSLFLALLLCIKNYLDVQAAVATLFLYLARWGFLVNVGQDHIICRDTCCV